MASAQPQCDVSGAKQPAAWYMLTTRTGQQPLHKVIMDNWQSALTVSLVSVPLSISLGIASVAGDDPAAPTMGVATAFWGGLSAGLFGSSDLNIVGPAGALSGMLNTYTIQFNGSGVLPYLSLFSAIWVFLVWALNLQRYLLLMPKAVFEGFTMAVAIIIGLNQLNMAFDLKPPGPKHKHFYENVWESLKVLDEAQAAPTIFFLVTCGLLLGLAKYVPKIRGISVPWTVILPLLTMVFGYLSESDNLGGIEIPTLKKKYGVLEARIVEPPNQPLSYYAQGKASGILVASFGIAFVAVLETLISAKIAEQKTDWGFDDSRETLGLVAAHTVCGAVGAMPPTGVFVRTSLNMQLGATHKASQIMNAVAVFVISVAAMPVFSYMPQAAVAALLIFASVRMAPVKYVCELWRNDKGSCALLIITMLICVFMDPVYGLVIGMVIALLRDAAETAMADSRLTVVGNRHQPSDLSEMTEDADINQAGVDEDGNAAWKRGVSTWTGGVFDEALGLKAKRSIFSRVLSLFRKNAEDLDSVQGSELCENAAGAVVVYEPIGPIVYLAADKHGSRFKAMISQKPAAVVLSLELATRVDMDGSEALGKGVKQLEEAGIAVHLVSPQAFSGGILDKAAWVRKLTEKGHIHEHRADAIKVCREEHVVA